MMNNREQRLFDTIRAAAAARDLQSDDPYAYHFSSDTYEEETLQLIDEQKLQQQEDSSTYDILGKSEVEQAQIDTAAAANGEISAKAEKQQEADVIVVRVGSAPDVRQSKSPSDAKMDNINGEMDDIQTEESPSHRAVDDPVDISTKKDDETHVATSSSIGSANEVKTTDHPAATKVIHQGQEEMMTNLIDAGKIGGASTANGPFGLPVYAWGIIGVAAGLAIVVVGAMIVKRRGRKSKTKRSRECDDESAPNQHHRSGTKKRVAIDYGGEGDDVDVEELSVVSNISSLSGGTFVVRHDRV